MAIWVELHCDIKSDGPPDPTRIHPSCYSNNGNSPGVLTSSNRGNMLRSIRMLEKRALTNGWRRTAGANWVCPNCRKETS